MLRSFRNHPATRTTCTPNEATPISLAGVAVTRGRVDALRNVTFDVPAGTLSAVIGPNGAGKSSLFGLLSGRLAQSSGAVNISGPVAEVMQTTRIDGDLALTVEDVVRIGRYANRGFVRPMRTIDKRIIDEALHAVDLQPLRRRPIQELSGGQRQRALLAQGLAQEAPVLLLDEPTSGLDPTSQRLVIDILRREADRGTTVLFATHDLTEAARADNVIVLACECICCAPPVDAFGDPAVTALFGPALHSPPARDGKPEAVFTAPPNNNQGFHHAYRHLTR